MWEGSRDCLAQLHSIKSVHLCLETQILTLYPLRELLRAPRPHSCAVIVRSEEACGHGTWMVLEGILRLPFLTLLRCFRPRLIGLKGHALFYQTHLIVAS